MPKSRLVLASSDEWMTNLIGAVLRDADIEVEVVKTASLALELLARTAVDAIIADSALPDDASWLATQVREGPRPTTPVLLLAHAEDSFSRMEALRAGADVCLTKPFRADELCLQVLATIAMARRCAGVQTAGAAPLPSSLRTPPPSESPHAALEGDIGQVSLATVLSLLELERRSGVMLIHGKQEATLTMYAGAAAKATLGGAAVAPIAALRRILRWKTGRFSFQPAEDTMAISGHPSIGALLIEAARLDDELPSSKKLESLPPPSGEDDSSLELIELGPPTPISPSTAPLPPAPPLPPRPPPGAPVPAAQSPLAEPPRRKPSWVPAATDAPSPRRPTKSTTLRPSKPPPRPLSKPPPAPGSSRGSKPPPSKPPPRPAKPPPPRPSSPPSPGGEESGIRPMPIIDVGPPTNVPIPKPAGPPRPRNR